MLSWSDFVAILQLITVRNISKRVSFSKRASTHGLRSVDGGAAGPDWFLPDSEKNLTVPHNCIAVSKSCAESVFG